MLHMPKVYIHFFLCVAVLLFIGPVDSGMVGTCIPMIAMCSVLMGTAAVACRGEEAEEGGYRGRWRGDWPQTPSALSAP